MSIVSRRNFIKTSATAATTSSLLVAPHIAKAATHRNDALRVAVVGVQGRGGSHIAALHELAEQNVDLVAMCDVHAGFLSAAAQQFEELSGRKVKLYDDMRKVLDDKSIDAVTFATPNHWHALGTVWACQADKDVYVEKPGSQNFAEGRVMINAARKYRRIVQHGTQMRSSPNIREGMSKLHDGVIGRVYMVRVVNYKVHDRNLGRHAPSPPPKELNWDQWVGPGPETPFSNFNWKRYNWRWDFGVGDIGNQGVHQLDLVRWGLQQDTHPTKVQAMGGNLFHLREDDCQCPCLLTASYQFHDGDVLVTCETRDGYTNPEAGMGTEYPFVDHKNVVGVIFYGTEGYMIMPDYSSYHTFLGRSRERGPYKSIAGNPMMDVDHFRNWVEAVRARDAGKLNAEIEQGHYSSALCHLANLAYRVGQTIEFDPQKEQVNNNELANLLLERRQYRSPFELPRIA